MPSWSEIQDYARSKYNLSHDEDDLFGIIFAFEDGRTQLIVVKRFEAFDQECIEFRTAVCNRSDMKPTVALEKNARFAIGALALDGERYYLMHNAMLRGLDLDEFELPLRVLASVADELEKAYAGGDEY